jgi:hypothetical protein
MRKLKRRPYGEVKALVVIGASVAAYFAVDQLLIWRYGLEGTSAVRACISGGAAFVVAWLVLRLVRPPSRPTVVPVVESLRTIQPAARDASVGQAEWFILAQNRETGPFTVTEMKAIAATGGLRPDSFVRKGQSGWGYAQDHAALVAIMAGKAPALDLPPTESDWPPIQQDPPPSPSVVGAASLLERKCDRPWWYMRPAYVAIAAIFTGAAASGLAAILGKLLFGGGLVVDVVALLVGLVVIWRAKVGLDRAMMNYHRQGEA